MVSPADPSAFFTLPLELRQIIYKAVLASPLYGPELLTACREIYLESHKFLFQRPLGFRSQKALFAWLNKVPHKFLSQAKELSIDIQEVDLRILLDVPPLNYRLGGPPRLLTWGLYKLELNKLHNALSHLPSVEKITVRAIAGHQSSLYRAFLRKFLTLATSVYPNLLTINLEGNFHHIDLTFLSGFKLLENLSFDGFSASSSTETARVLSGLKGLTSLSLVSRGTILTPDLHAYGNLTSGRQSLTGSAVSMIDHLKSFSFTETSPIFVPSLFLTPEFLTPLCNHKNLKVLTICLSQTPDNETLSALENFLGESHIRVLSLDWPQLDPNMLETFSLIPERLEALWIRASVAKDACEMLFRIAKHRGAGRFRALREVIVLRSTRFSGDATPTSDWIDRDAENVQINSNDMHPCLGDTDAINLVRAQLRLGALDTRVSWCTDRP